MNSLRMTVVGAAVASATAISAHHNNNTTTTTTITPTTPHVAYTTEVVTAYTTYCPAPTTITHGGKTYTVTSATTLTITDCPCTVTKPAQHTTTPAHGDHCATGCLEAYNKCRGTHGANLSTCGSEYAGCLGYNPFTGSNGSLVTPTACSTKPAAPTKPAVPTHPAGAKECADACSDAYNKCRGAPHANLSTCGSEYAGCLGFSPFGRTNGTFVTPTACATKPAAPTSALPPKPTQPAAGKGCAEKCNDAYNQCRAKSGANLSTCASDFTGCLGYSPFNGNGSLVTPTACSTHAPASTPHASASATGTVPAPPAPHATKPSVVTAGAGAVAPAKVLLALGAIALL